MTTAMTAAHTVPLVALGAVVLAAAVYLVWRAVRASRADDFVTPGGAELLADIHAHVHAEDDLTALADAVYPPAVVSDDADEDGYHADDCACPDCDIDENGDTAADRQARDDRYDHLEGWRYGSGEPLECADDCPTCKDVAEERRRAAGRGELAHHDAQANIRGPLRNQELERQDAGQDTGEAQ